MLFTKLLTVSTLALTVASSAMAENVLRWTSQGDALTLDPHSQNESHDRDEWSDLRIPDHP